MAHVIRQSITVGNLIHPPALRPREYWEPRSGQGPIRRVGELEYSYTNFHLSWNRELFQEKPICQHFQHALHTEELERLQKKKKEEILRQRCCQMGLRPLCTPAVRTEARH